MPRVKYTRTVYHYSFTPPSSITRFEYESYKQMLLANPNAAITKKTDVRKRNDFMYVLLVIGLICFGVGLMVCLSAEDSSKAPGWGIFMVFGSLFFILAPIVNSGKLASALNEDHADNERNQYFDNLRNMIRESNSYDEFNAKYMQWYRARR